MRKIILLLLLVLATASVYAVQPTQQYNKILLSPFYINGMTQNLNYNYNVSVITPDGISNIKTAIITLDAWINPTRTFNAWMNNVQCNTKNYTILTTYASAGRGVVTFDCTNAIQPNKVNTVRFVVTGGNIGASTAWLDLTYMNNPKGVATVHGTEYNNEQDAKVWLQLLDGDGDYVLDGTCYVDIYTPDNEEYIELAQMSNLLHDGVYYYDFPAPLIEGVYPVIARCYYGSQEIKYYVTNFTVITGKTARSIALDDFECNAFTCGSGWNAAWSYTGNCAIVTTPTPIGTYAMRGQTVCDATRRFDNTAYTNINVSFYIAATSLEAGDYCRYYYYNGVSYTELIAITDGADTGVYTKYTFDVTTYGSSVNAGIRMLGGPASGDYCYIDSINITGTVNQGLSRLTSIDGIYWGMIENLSGGINRINATIKLNASACNAVSESLLTGINIQLNGKFDSVANDDISLAIYNWTGGVWVNLSNELLEGTTFTSVSNVILLNNLTKPGYYNSTTGTIMIRVLDSTFSDTVESVLLLDQLYLGCEQANDAVWQEVKGSSEVHVSNTGEAYPFDVSTLCGLGDDSSCAEFINDELYWNYTWGYIFDNVTVINNYQTDIDSFLYYETWHGVDCTAIIDIVENGATSITDIVTLSAGNKENCIISIPITFASTDREVYFELSFDNFMKWDVQRMKDYVNYYDLIITPFCEEVASIENNPYIIPIGGEDVSTIYYNNPVYLGCYRTMDDLYWFNDYYTNSLDITTAGAFESYFLEVNFYYPEVREHATIVMNIGELDFLIHVDDSCDHIINYTHGEHNYTTEATVKDGSCAIMMPPDEYYASQEGYLIENLTIYNTFNAHMHTTYEYTTMPGIDCTAILEIYEVKNDTITDLINLTRFELTIDNGCRMILPIALDIDENNYSIIITMENYELWDIMHARDNVKIFNSTISTYCDGIAAQYNITYEIPIENSTYYNNEIDYCTRALDDLYWWNSYYQEYLDSGMTAIGELGGIWYESNFFFEKIVIDFNVLSAYSRNANQALTLSIVQEILANTSQNVWTYNNRTLTYYPPASVDTNAVANDVWNATNRNLTYYPAQVDMTNYTRIDTTILAVNNSLQTRFDLLEASLIIYFNNIAGNVWTYINRTLTTFGFDNTDYNRIQTETWNATNRNLTYYPEQVDLTNYSKISNLTAQEVWEYTIRDLTYYAPAYVNETAVAVAVWNSTTRDLTYYPAQVDLTNYSLINQGIWTYNDRNLTYYPSQVDLTNYSAIESGVWAYNNRTLTYYPTPTDLTNYTLINEGVWTYIDRNLTYYPEQIDFTNYSKISNLTATDVWTYATRDLTYYEVNNITAADVWTYINRTLTYYELNNITATDVWTYNNRTLTYYPAVDTTAITESVWSHTGNISEELLNQTTDHTWNYVGRYVHGIIN